MSYPSVVQPVNLSNQIADEKMMTEQISDLGEDPVIARCPYCSYQGLTETNKKIGTCNYLGSLACCLNPCLWCGCCLLPCLPDRFKDTEHKCANCGETIGKKKKI